MQYRDEFLVDTNLEFGIDTAFLWYMRQSYQGLD